MLDRALQRELLTKLAPLYPQAASMQCSFRDVPHQVLVVNLYYLDEHGLVVLSANETMSRQIILHSVKITAAGLDFLADDGGLSSILHTVDVRLHGDTLRQIIESRVNKAEGDPGVKQAIKQALVKLPSEAMSKLATQALEHAMDQTPDIVRWLQKWLGL